MKNDFPKELLDYVYKQNAINNQKPKNAKESYNLDKVYFEIKDDFLLGCLTEKKFTREEDFVNDKTIKTFFEIKKFIDIVLSLKNNGIYTGKTDFCIYSNITKTNFYDNKLNEKKESVSYGEGLLVLKDNFFYKIQNANIYKSIDWSVKNMSMDKFEEAERFCLERLIKN